MGMERLKLIKLTKKIKGRTIYEDLDFVFEKGHIYGIVGKNGSGKTMLLRSLAGLVKPTWGSFALDGHVIDDMQTAEVSIGFTIENINLYPELTAMENLRYLADIRGYAFDNLIWELLKKFSLYDAKDTKVSKYSMGMRQKLTLIQAFMENPELILLDEPTNALDEHSVQEFYEIVRNHAKRGAVIVIASHSKEDIQELCDQVYEFS